MTKFNEQDRRDLSKALSYANWALLGILVPFLGWLLAAMSLSFVKIIPVNKQSRDRINQVRNAAWLAIALSTLSFSLGAVIYYQVFTSMKKSDENRINSQRATELIDAKNCTAKANEKYYTYLSENNSTPNQKDSFGNIAYGLTNQQWDIVRTTLENDKNECFRKYNNFDKNEIDPVPILVN